MQDEGEEQVLTGRIDKCRRLPGVGRNVSVRGVVTGNETWRVWIGEVAAVEFVIFQQLEQNKESRRTQRDHR